MRLTSWRDGYTVGEVCTRTYVASGKMCRDGCLGVWGFGVGMQWRLLVAGSPLGTRTAPTKGSSRSRAACPWSGPWVSHKGSASPRRFMAVTILFGDPRSTGSSPPLLHENHDSIVEYPSIYPLIVRRTAIDSISITCPCRRYLTASKSKLPWHKYKRLLKDTRVRVRVWSQSPPWQPTMPIHQPLLS